MFNTRRKCGRRCNGKYRVAVRLLWPGGLFKVTMIRR
jgi:hypothetical protein